jgi:hypothetical protein
LTCTHLYLLLKADEDIDLLRRFFVDNPHLQLLHLKWEFSAALQAIVPPSVRFLKISLFNKDTSFLPPPIEHDNLHHRHHHHGQPPPPAAAGAAPGFTTVRALAVVCPIENWKELLPWFSKYIYNSITYEKNYENL